MIQLRSTDFWITSVSAAAATVTDADEGFGESVYKSVVRGLLLTALATTTIAAQAPTAHEDFPTFSSPSVALEEDVAQALPRLAVPFLSYQVVDDELPITAAAAPFEEDLAQAIPRLAAPFINYQVADDDLPVAVVANAALEEDYQPPFVPQQARPFLTPTVDEDFPPYPIVDDVGVSWTVVSSPQAYIYGAPDEEFPALSAVVTPLVFPDDEGQPIPVVARGPVLPLSLADEDSPAFVVPSLAFPDDDGQWATLTATKPFLPPPIQDEDFPFSVVPSFVFPDDDGQPIPIVAQVPLILFTVKDDEFPALVAPAIVVLHGKYQTEHDGALKDLHDAGV